MKGILPILLILGFVSVSGFRVSAQCDDDLPSGSIAANYTPTCPSTSVELVFSLSGDDDEFTVIYRIGSNTTTLTDIEDGHSVQFDVTQSTTINQLTL